MMTKLQGSIRDTVEPGENFDIKSYIFGDMDLERAVAKLPERTRTVMILHFMGHSQLIIGRHIGRGRSMVSKIITGATSKLANSLR